MGDMDMKRPNKKVVLSVLGVLVILVIAAGAGIGLRIMQDDKAAEEVSSGMGNRPLPENVTSAQNLRLEGDAEGSLKQIDESLGAGSTTKQEKYLLYIQQGNVHADNKDYAAAIASYAKAEEVDRTFEIVKLLAVMYETSGNNAKAIEYWQKSIPLIPDTPMRGDYRRDAEEKIRQLGGQA